MNNIGDKILEHRSRVLKLMNKLQSFFVEKDEEIRMLIVAAVSGEPLLFVGEPGTAKSDIVVKFVKLLGLYNDNNKFFEYMLTRFTEPSEIIGPVDIMAMKNNLGFLRKTDGMLPKAEVVFLDEVFKANSAILNVLLTIINEKKFYQEGQAVSVPLKMFFAATNSISQDEELSALKDRFTLKIKTEPVSDDKFESLLVKGLTNEFSENIEPVASLEDFLKIREFANYQFQNALVDMKQYAGDSVLAKLKKTLATISKDTGIFISDRKKIKIYKMLRIHSILFGNGDIVFNNSQKQFSSYEILKYIGNDDENLSILKEVINDLIIRTL